MLLGNTAPWYDREDETEGRVPLHAGSDGVEALAKAAAFVATLKSLRAAGLSAESVFTLLRTYAQGSTTHLLRANYERDWVKRFDEVLFGAFEHFAGFALDDSQRAQATMRLRDGGCAFPSAEATAPRAYMGSWALVLQSVAACVGVTSLESFRARCPHTARTLSLAEGDLRAQGGMGPTPFDWAACLAEPRAKLQGGWGETVSERNRKRLLSTLDTDNSNALRASGGTGAGSWLLPREEGDAPIPDFHYLVNLRTRLRAAVYAPGALCQHTKEDGSLCGELLDSKGWHARKCGCGGSRSYRHNSLRDWHGPFHTAQTGMFAVTEMHVPAWDRTDPDTGELEEAILDVCTRDAASGRPIYIDWSVTCEHSTNHSRRQARSGKDGLAATQAVAKKRQRYPPAGGELVPAVLESGGRPSDELIAFIRTYGQGLGPADRSAVISSAWRQISRTLAVGNAEMLLSAGHCLGS